jgi:pyridoxine kinase
VPVVPLPQLFTAGLAKGYSVEKAVALAKKFVAAAIKNGQKINPFLGHVWHGAYNHAEERLTEPKGEQQ